ncbi:RWD repeat domain-containing protein [Xylaria nigripes]|nr:RWD repeat domain-containing protein [Xylaria nigripes]
MSDELLDEVEAINSIYGEGCLVSSNDASTYILTPPGESASFRVEFPLEYPAVPPTVAGTNSTGLSGKKGDAARKLALFCQALGNVYEPGSVCLFDAVEEFGRLLGEQEPERQEEADTDLGKNVNEDSRALTGTAPMGELKLTKEPAWIVSDPVVELKSTFVARCAKVLSTAEAEAFVQHLIASDKKVRAATHNMTAWRIRGPNNTAFQDCNDDGETAAGGRLLHLMQLMDLWDVMVVVTRWYGGHKLGPRRFALINQAARDSFVKAGLVTTDTKKK